MRNTAPSVCLIVLATASAALAQDTAAQPSTSPLAALNGTYTIQMVILKGYSVEYNMSGQQVGFCNGQTAIGYGCDNFYTFDLLAVTLISDGAGRIVSGSSYADSRDPNSYQCKPSNKPTVPCPLVVPSGHTWSASTTYGVGATVDYIPSTGGKTRTYQAVKNNINRPPNWTVATYLGNICNWNNLSICTWTEIPASQTSGDSNSTGNIVGSYTIQANGSGTITLTNSSCASCGPIHFDFTVSPTSEVGQTITVAGVSILDNANRSVGTGTRIK